MTRFSFQKQVRTKKNVVSDTCLLYTNIDYTNVKKFMKVTSNSTQCEKAQKNKKVVSKKYEKNV